MSRLLCLRPPPSWDCLLYKLPCLLQNPNQAIWWALVDGEIDREPVMNPALRDDLAVAGLTAILAGLGQGSASKGHVTTIAPQLLRLLDEGAKLSPALWNKFLKSALKFGLTDGPLLALLNSTMRRLFVAPPSGLLSLTKIHAMLCSHSMFVSTLLTVERNEIHTCGDADLQQRMEVKRELVKLLLFVMEKEPTVCQSEHFPVLLGAYTATLDSIDRQLLFLLQFYENHNVRLSNLRMLLWGEAVTEQRQKRETLGFTLWQEPSSRHVLSLLQHDRMLNTALHFPLQRRLLSPVTSEEFSVEVFGEESENMYDPCFLLPLFSTLAAPGSDLDCRYFTSMNGLAVVLTALASYDPAMRSAAYHVLAAFHTQLEGARFREKAELLYLLEFTRGGICKANACLSFLVAIFLAKTASVLLRPEDSMYPHLNRFMLSHEFIDTNKVPAFYKFFFSSQAECAGQTTVREWALSVLDVGLRDRTCVELCARQHVFIILLAYAGGPLADGASKDLVIKVLMKAARIPAGAYRLVRDHGVLCWLVGLLRQHLYEHKVLDSALELLKTLWKTNLGKKGTEGIKSESDGEKAGSVPKYTAQAALEGLEVGYDEDEDEEKKESVDDGPAAQEAERSRQTTRTGPTIRMKCLPMQMINEFVLVQHTFLKQDSVCRDVQSFCCLSRLLASMLSHRRVAMAAADKAGHVLANRSGLCHADMLYLLGAWARLACPCPARDALERKAACHDAHDDAGVRESESKPGKTCARPPRHGTSLQADKASPMSSAAQATRESRLHLLRIMCCWLPQEELRNAGDGRETVADTMKLCLEWLFADDTCYSLSSSDLLHLLRWLRNCAMSFAPLHTVAGMITTGLLRLIDKASAGSGDGRRWTAGTVSELQKEAQGLSESLLELLRQRTCDRKGNGMSVRSRCILDKVVIRFLVPAARDFDHPHLRAAASSLVSLFQHEMWLSDDSPNLFLWLLGRMAEQGHTSCNPELFNNIFSALAKIRKSKKLIAT
uniref:nucleolar pre-ribosomal-associated protein 1 isoform X2 n=1 Tax=Myxine glutinosa TaxID=7769 RepID=UPI00358E6922